MQTAIMYAVITLLMSGLLVGFGLPFLALAWLAWRWTAGRLGDAARLALASAIAALGIAPAYDPYGGPLPIAVRLMRGEPVTVLGALVSLSATFIVLVALARLLVRRRPRMTTRQNARRASS